MAQRLGLPLSISGESIYLVTNNDTLCKPLVLVLMVGVEVLAFVKKGWLFCIKHHISKLEVLLI